MDATELERGWRAWLAVRAAGEGSHAWKQAQDHWFGWAREHGIELMGLAARDCGAATIEDIPQNMITAAADEESTEAEPTWRADRIAERVLARAGGHPAAGETQTPG